VESEEASRASSSSLLLEVNAGSEDDELRAEKFDMRCCKVKGRVYQTALLCMINVFLFADQNLLSPQLTAISREFGFTPVERDRKLGGDVALYFFLTGAISSLVAGCLIDSVNRIWTLAIVVIIGESACLATFWVKTYNQLLVARALTGVSIGGSIPASFSLLGDLYETTSRGKVVSVLGISMGFGVGLGQMIAGLLGPSLGWRVPFAIVAVPAFFLAIVLVCTTRDPKRAQKEEVLTQVAGDKEIIYTERITIGKFVSLFSSPTVALMLLQGLPCSLAWGVLLIYMNDFLSQALGISVELSTLIVLSYGVGIVLGQLWGGWLADRWFLRHKKLLSLVMGSFVVLGGVPIILMLYETSQPLWIYFVLAAPGGFLAGAPSAIMRALLLNVTLPEIRGTAFAVLNLVDDLGRGVGPYFVSLIIEAFPGRRVDALAISISTWLVGGILLACTVFTLERDVANVDSKLLEQFIQNHPVEDVEQLMGKDEVADRLEAEGLADKLQELEMTIQ